MKAIQFTGDNTREVIKWVALNLCSAGDKFHHRLVHDEGRITLEIMTLEQKIVLNEGSWLVLGQPTLKVSDVQETEDICSVEDLCMGVPV